MAELDLLAALRRESARFLAALRAVEPATPVPSCPGWTASDLLGHLCEDQWFWGTIVTDRLADPGAAEDAKPDRPHTHADLAELMARSTARLHDALASTDPSTAVWTWTHDRDVAVRDDASTLDRWLWGRSSRDGLAVDGDQAVLDPLDAVVAEGSQ